MAEIELVIKIDEEDLEWIQTHRSVTDYQITQMLYKRVMNGTPLDDVKAEIIEKSYRYFIDAVNDYSDEEVIDLSDVLSILDNIGKAESEE